MKFAIAGGAGTSALHYTLTLTTATATTLLRLNVPVAGAAAPGGGGKAYKAWVTLQSSGSAGEGGKGWDVYRSALRVTLTQLTGHAAALVRFYHSLPIRVSITIIRLIG